jgi:hypothetical protein
MIIITIAAMASGVFSVSGLQTARQNRVVLPVRTICGFPAICQQHRKFDLNIRLWTRRWIDVPRVWRIVKCQGCNGLII